MNDSQIITCGGMDCSVCSVISTVSGLFHYLSGISAAVAILLVVTAGFLYLSGRGDEEKLSRAKRFLMFAVFGFALTLVSFIVILSTYLFSGAKSTGNWYRVDCSTDSPIEAKSQPPENIADTSYLENNESSIVDSGNIGSIVSGDNRIVRLKPGELNSDNVANDIKLLDPERKLNFVAGNREISGEDIVDFRNVNLGFEKDKSAGYVVDKEEGMADQITSFDGKVRPIFSVNTTDAEDNYWIEWGSDIKKFTGASHSDADSEGVKKIADSLKRIAQVSDLGGKDIYAYTSGTPMLINEKPDSCEASRGEMTEFSNPCFADKEHWESRDLKCSKIYNPITACDCPSGFYLAGEKCVNANKLEEEENDNTGDRTKEGYKTGDRGKYEEEKKTETKKKKVSSAKSCADISLEEHKCPVSRCEGDVMMIYPDSVKDECLESLQGPRVTKKFCEGQESGDAAENQKCKEIFDQKSDAEKIKEADDYFKRYGDVPDWYERLIDKEFSKGEDFQPQNGAGAKTGNIGKNIGAERADKSTGIENKDEGTGSATTGSVDTGGKTPDAGGKTPTDTGPLPPDQGAGNFNPTPTFQELKECVGLSGDQIPYNGILVVLLHPENFDRSDRFLVNNHNENISRMFYLSRDGKVIGKNGEDLGRTPMAGGQEYGARDFSKGASNRSMWGRGWKIFKGPTIYWKGSGYRDYWSFGSHDGYKIGDYTRNDQGNLGGGEVFLMGRCGQHEGKKGSSAGCATLGNKSRRGFVEKSKEYMTQSNGTIMQVNLKGEMDANGKFKSPDCGKIDYCGAKRSFQNSEAKKFRNDPNEGYQQGDKRRVQC